MLTLTNVSAWYDDYKVLNNISLDLKKGENICILGPNGCGKTTLLRTIADLIPFKGTIEFQGQDMKKMKRKEIASRVAIMSQISTVYFPYTVYEAVMVGRYQHMKSSIFGGIPTKRDRKCVEEWLDKTGLTSLQDKKLDELSGGQLQRVFLAQTMVQEPDVILLDEPTNHLDIKYQLELVQYLKEWSQVGNRMVIGVFHDINLAMQLSENLVFLNAGEIAGMGEAKRIINSAFLQDIYGVDINKYMIDSLEKWKGFEKM